MSRIFISHSSKDNYEAVALKNWLGSVGWKDVFLDLDPEGGIAPGDRWERALHEAATRCEAVVFLISPNWLGSTWCLKEYGLARGLNKKLFAVLIDPTKSFEAVPAELKATWQAVDLVGGQDLQLFPTRLDGSHEERHVGFSRSGLVRLRRGLEKAGLDPRFFAWPPPHDPARFPYRGLKPIDAVDAGIFFGRDATIIEGRDRLRGLATGDKPRLLVILGASGAGKSSFLRGGLLPRLARDDGTFVPVAPIRPEHAALFGESGLLKAIGKAFPERSLGKLRPAVAAGAAGLKPLLAELAETARRRRLEGEEATRPPVIVIPIDQAEELFRPEAGDEGARLLEIIRDLVASDDPAVIAIFAIRSDAYDALEHAKAFEGMKQSTLPLLPMPRASYNEVIEGPARRYRQAGHQLDLDPMLTLRILKDLEDGGSDALPLLAFMLEQLFLEYHQDGAISLDNYEQINGLKGAIDAAVERAFERANRDPRIPAERQAREALLRRGLIPWLAGIDPDTKKVRRNIARLSDIPPEAAPLLGLLKEERLLSSDRVKVEDPTTGTDSWLVTVEPTHEALLRQWGLLDGWLKEDFGLLATLEGVKRGTRDWNANARDETWLVHRGQRLADALALDQRPDIAARLDDLDRAYITRCQALEEAEHRARQEEQRHREEARQRELRDAKALAEAESRTARRTRMGLFVALALVGIVGVVAGFWLLQWRKTGDALRDTQAALAIGDSEASLRNQHYEAAVAEARKAFDLRPSTASRTALLSALLAVSPHLQAVRAVGGRNGTALAWVDADTVAVGLDSGDVAYKAATGKSADAPAGFPPVTIGNKGVLLMAPREGGTIVVQADGHGTLTRKGGAGEAWFDPGQPVEPTSATSAAAALSGDDRTLAIAAVSGGIVVLRHGGSGRPAPAERTGGDTYFTTVALSPDGARWVAATEKGALLVGDSGTASAGTALPVPVKSAALAWSPDGHLLAAGATDGTLAVIDMSRPDATPVTRRFSEHSLLGLAWRPQGDMLALPCGHLVCIWQPKAAAGPCGPPSALRLSGHESNIRAIAWSRDGTKLATLDMGNALRVWTLAADMHVRSVSHCAGAGRIATLAASPDGQRVFAGAETGDAFAWTPPDPTAQRLAKIDGGAIAALALDADGRLAAARDDGILTIWAKGPAQAPSDLPVSAGRYLSRLDWLAADKHWVVLESEHGVIDLVDPAQQPPAGVTAACPTTDDPLAEAFAPERNAHRLFVSFAGHLGVCDLDAGRWLAPIALAGNRTVAAQSLATSLDGRWLAKSGGEEYATLIDIAAPANRQLLSTGRREPMTVAFSPDSRNLAVMADDSSIGIWSLEGPGPAQLAFKIENVGGLPDQQPDGKSRPSAIAWVGNSRLAIATSTGTMTIVNVDSAAWLQRSDQLDGNAGSGAN